MLNLFGAPFSLFCHAFLRILSFPAFLPFDSSFFLYCAKKIANLCSGTITFLRCMIVPGDSLDRKFVLNKYVHSHNEGLALLLFSLPTGHRGGSYVSFAITIKHLHYKR